MNCLCRRIFGFFHSAGLTPEELAALDAATAAIAANNAALSAAVQP